VSVALGAPVLSAQGLAKRFGEREALRGVSFQSHAGELLAVIGPNGAGKTTLLSILAGVQEQSAGTLSTGAGGVGWVPQQPAVYAKLSVAENLRLFARLEGVADPEAAVARMLAQTGLRDRADEQLGRLSGGNRQRVNIAVGLLADPPVVLLDEPSSSLDPLQRERLWSFIEQLAERGTSVVFSTHNVVEAERHARRLLVLADGELLFEGSPAELLAEAAPDGEAQPIAAPQPGAPQSAAPQPAAPRTDFEAAFVALLRSRGH
jgi:ABC-2 type transport system ATP-binding protein